MLRRGTGLFIFFACLCLFLRCSRHFPWLSTFVRLRLPQFGQLRELSVQKSECWQSRRVGFSYFALCLCVCIFTYICLFLRYTRLERYRAEVGVPVKGTKPLNKLEKIPHTYFASIPTLGRITLRAVQSVMDAVQQSCTGKGGIRTTEEQAKLGKKSANADKK